PDALPICDGAARPSSAHTSPLPALCSSARRNTSPFATTAFSPHEHVTVVVPVSSTTSQPSSPVRSLWWGRAFRLCCTVCSVPWDGEGPPRRGNEAGQGRALPGAQHQCDSYGRSSRESSSILFLSNRPSSSNQPCSPITWWTMIAP